MTIFKKQKERKKMLNNPPTKVTVLKSSREVDKYSLKNSYSRPGEFGLMTKDNLSMNSTRDLNRSRNSNVPVHLTSSYNKAAEIIQQRKKLQQESAINSFKRIQPQNEHAAEGNDFVVQRMFTQDE